MNEKPTHNPNENREVLVYNHLVGDNFCLKFIIKFKRKKGYVFYLYLMQLLCVDTTIFEIDGSKVEM